MTFYEAFKRLQAAAVQLESSADKGRIGRRNARDKMKRALKNVRAAMDAQYPAFRKTAQGRKQLSHAAKVRRLKKKGWEIAAFAGPKAGQSRASLEREWRTLLHAPYVALAEPGGGATIWAPRWAVHVVIHAPDRDAAREELLRWKKMSPKQRQAELVAATLAKAPGP